MLRNMTVQGKKMQALTSFPEEILAIVVRFIAEDDCGGRSTLNHLCQTCTTFQRLVQPVLYSRLQTSQEGCVSLARTIAQRPDLATFAKHLYPGVDWILSDKHFSIQGKVPRPWQLSRDDIFLIRGILARYKCSTFLWREYMSGPGKSGDELAERELQSIISTLLIVQCINVETVTFKSASWTRLQVVQDPPRLDKLTELSILLDTDNEEVTFAELEWVFKAAKNMTRFSVDCLYSIPDTFHHPNLSNVSISYTQLSEGHFEALFRGLPNLKIFSYSSRTGTWAEPVIGSEATPRAISNLLRIRSDSITSLKLCWKACSPHWEESEYLTDLAHMSKMTMLELDIDEVFLGQRYNGHLTQENCRRLLQLIPQSLTHLIINYDDCDGHVESLAELIPKYRPNLKSVHVGFTKSFNRGPFEMVNKYGVKLVWVQGDTA